MTLCPIALAVGCKKCPAFSVCPLKTVLGDQVKEDAVTKAATNATEPGRPRQSNGSSPPEAG